MRKKKVKTRVLVLILFILSMGLGYALLTQDLTINGVTRVKGNTWDIHFNNVQINSNSVSLSSGDSAASIDSNDNTLVNYTVTLKQPGDFYEFTVDAVNAGTVDGMIGEVISKLNGTVISSTNPLPSYLNYTFSYEDDIPVESNHLLEAGHTETYKVRLEFKLDIENSELPSTDQTNAFSVGVDYLQRTGSAIPIPRTYTINIVDDNDEENTMVMVGETIPNAITQYHSQEEVISALETMADGSVDKPIYLKHNVENGVVTASYVEFVVTEEMVYESPNMTAGTYQLRGGLDDYDFDSILETLQRAFGFSACEYQGSYYKCSASRFQIFIYDNGNLIVGDDYYSCGIGHSGESGCSGSPVHTVTKYTANIGDLYGPNMIFVGQTIPNGITLYDTSSAARAVLTLDNDGVNVPFCLKHAITNDDKVDASYIEFTITNAMVQANPGMTAGTYVIKGDTEKGTYENNISIVVTAFGETNCTVMRAVGRSTFCSVAGMGADVYSTGKVQVYLGDINSSYYRCLIETGKSICSRFTNGEGS